MKGDDISERLLAFSVRVIRVAKALPRDAVGKHVGGQLLRAGTSAGANYEEARGAETKKDFAHKLGITLKELRETLYWLKVIQGADLLAHDRLSEIIDETDELTRIIGKSIVTARGADRSDKRRN